MHSIWLSISIMDAMQENQMNTNDLPYAPTSPLNSPTSPSYSPTSPSNVPMEATYAEWFSETYQKILAQRKVDRYVYQFDKAEDDAWFTATLKELVDDRARNGYQYVLE